jgi:hypothetical protein
MQEGERKRPNRRRPIFIGVWLNEAEAARLRAAAVLRGQTPNELVRTMIEQALPGTVEIRPLPVSQRASSKEGEAIHA